MSSKVSRQQGRSGQRLILPVCLVVDPVDGLVARVGDLLCVFGELDLGDKFAGLFVLTAASLYTPPKAGQSLEVMRLVPTPQELMAWRPESSSCAIRYSSRSLEAEMTASGKPAASSIFLRLLWTGRPGRRCPGGCRRFFSGIPASRISLKTRMALGTPDFSVS